MSLTLALQDTRGSKYTVNCTAREVGQVQYTTQKGKPYQVIHLDDGQIAMPVRIYQGNGQPIAPAMIGQQIQVTVSSYIGGDNQRHLSGFWNAGAQVDQSPVVAEQANAARQELGNHYDGQPPAQTRNGPPDWDAIAEGKVRCAVLCALLQNGVNIHEVPYDLIIGYTRFVMTGIVPQPANNIPTRTPPGEVQTSDGMPFP